MVISRWFNVHSNVDWSANLHLNGLGYLAGDLVARIDRQLRINLNMQIDPVTIAPATAANRVGALNTFNCNRRLSYSISIFDRAVGKSNHGIAYDLPGSVCDKARDDASHQHIGQTESQPHKDERDEHRRGNHDV